MSYDLITSAFPAHADFITITAGASASNSYQRIGTFTTSVCTQISAGDVYSIDPDNHFFEYHIGTSCYNCLLSTYISDYYPDSGNIKNLTGSVDPSDGSVILTTISRQDLAFPVNGSLLGFKIYGQFPVNYDTGTSTYIGEVRGNIYSGNYTLTGTNLGGWSVSPVGHATTKLTPIMWHEVDVRSLGIDFTGYDTLTIAITAFKRNVSNNINIASLYYNVSSSSYPTGYGPYGRSEIGPGEDYNINFIYQPDPVASGGGGAPPPAGENCGTVNGLMVPWAGFRIPDSSPNSNYLHAYNSVLVEDSVTGTTAISAGVSAMGLTHYHCPGYFYINDPTPSVIFSKAFSVSIWWKPDDGHPEEHETIFSTYAHDVAAGGGERVEMTLSTDGRIWYRLQTQLSTWVGSDRQGWLPALSDGPQSDYTHIVLSMDALGIPTFYVDGSEAVDTLESGGAFQFSHYDSNHALGNINRACSAVGTPLSGMYFAKPQRGLVDDLSLWGYDLSAAQVSTIYNSGSGTSLLGMAGLSGWWEMESPVASAADPICDSP